MRDIHWLGNLRRAARLMLYSGLMACITAVPLYAQDLAAPAPAMETAVAAQEPIDRLQSIGSLIEVKRQQRDELVSVLNGSAPDAMQDERQRLITVTQDLESLRNSFELVLLDNVDTSLMSATEDAPFDWKQELVEVVEPLLISLKSLTRRPRQMAELRKTIDLETRRLAVADEALEAIALVPQKTLNAAARSRLTATSEKWLDTRNLVNENLMIARSQLDRSQNTERPLLDSVLTGMQSFLAGRGLTLLIATATAFLGWALMRLCWHVIQTRLIRKSVRRKATWFRLLAYSYHFFSVVVVIGIVLSVLYLRQDVLLMGLAFLMLAVAVVSLRTVLPRFLTEVRLLLNLGAVREEECVIHASLPWQVMSLNIHTVLRNPALDGVIRLPLDIMTTKVSRPTLRDELWFPTLQNDYIILPDRTFGQVMIQTPELVELSVKGGMSMTIPTAEFYAMSIMNLSRHKTFGIAVTFGFDYSLQSLSLTTIPEDLKAGVLTRLEEAGYQTGKDIVSVLVELSSAAASSLDFLVYTSVSSQRAADYYAIERLVQQACVWVANEKAWLIPFPQLTLHHQSATEDLPVSLKRAA